MSRGTVVLFDDQRKAITRVASSFSSFLRKLECDRPVAGFGGPNVPWIDPALSEYLHGQLRDLRISKDSMRTVCDDITRKNGSLSLRKGRQARKLCDFMFYLTTRRRPVRTVQDFLWAPDGALSLSTIFPWVVREFGRGLPGSGEVDRSFVPDWFGARITTDSLVETPHGYRLSDLDEELLLKAMRRAGATWALAEEAEEHDAEQVHSVAELVRVAMTQAGSAPEQDMPDARLSLRLDEAPLRCEVRVDWFGVPDSDEVLKVADEWNRERTAPRLLVDTDSSGHRRLSASMIIVSYAPATRHQIVHWTGWMTASMKAALDFLRRECGNVPVSPWTSDFASSCQNGGDLPVEGNITEGDPPAVTVDRIAQILFGERGEQTVVERFDRHGAGQMRLQTGQNAHIVDLTVHDGLMTLTDGQILGTLDEEQRQLCLSLCATDNLVAPGSTACLRRIWDEDTLEVNLTTYVGAGMDDRQLERAVVGSAAVVGARCAELVDRIAGR